MCLFNNFCCNNRCNNCCNNGCNGDNAGDVETFYVRGYRAGFNDAYRRNFYDRGSLFNNCSCRRNLDVRYDGCGCNYYNDVDFIF